MFDGKLYHYDASVHLPNLHLGTARRLESRLERFLDYYQQLYVRCVSEGMSPEPSDSYISGDAINWDEHTETRWRGVEKTGLTWRIEENLQGGAEDQWREVDAVPLTLGMLHAWQFNNDQPEPVGMESDELWLARIGARSVRLMWSIVAHRQRRDLEGKSEHWGKR